MDNAWIQTYSGLKLHPLNPKPEQIAMEDIAHALSLQCRFAGHCKWHYSVGYHSILVSQLLERWQPENKRLQLTGLLHDASEYALVDVPSPIKSAFGGYRDYEHTLMCVIADRFGFDWPPPPEVHKADMILCATEARALLKVPFPPWGALPEPDPTIQIEKLPPEEVESAFLIRAASLMMALGQ
jgi:hypothetical protein